MRSALLFSSGDGPFIAANDDMNEAGEPLLGPLPPPIEWFSYGLYLTLLLLLLVLWSIIPLFRGLPLLRGLHLCCRPLSTSPAPRCRCPPRLLLVPCCCMNLGLVSKSKANPESFICFIVLTAISSPKRRGSLENKIRM